jgi:hypothetical protein
MGKPLELLPIYWSKQRVAYVREAHGMEDIGHYIRRAREERALAQRARSAEGANAHRSLARHYEGLVALSAGMGAG